MSATTKEETSACIETTKVISKRDVEENKIEAKFPKSVFFIIGNEFCERFSYYGMRSKYNNLSFTCSFRP